MKNLKKKVNYGQIANQQELREFRELFNFLSTSIEDQKDRENGISPISRSDYLKIWDRFSKKKYPIYLMYLAELELKLRHPCLSDDSYIEVQNTLLKYKNTEIKYYLDELEKYISDWIEREFDSNDMILSRKMKMTWTKIIGAFGNDTKTEQRSKERCKDVIEMDRLLLELMDSSRDQDIRFLTCVAFKLKPIEEMKDLYQRVFNVLNKVKSRTPIYLDDLEKIIFVKNHNIKDFETWAKSEEELLESMEVDENIEISESAKNYWRIKNDFKKNQEA